MGQPDALHPIQGLSPDLKLVAQPPTQLPLIFSSLRIFAIIDSCAAVNGVVGDVGRDAALFATRVCLCGGLAACCGFCGLTICFGAWTVMLGSEGMVAAVVVCDIAVPLGPHSNAVDRIATAVGATRLDDIPIPRSPESGHQCGSGAETLPRIQPVFPKTNDTRASAIRYRAWICVRYLFRFSAVTRNFPPASMPVQYHQDRCRSQPRNILVSTHCT
jgi:hypothetical protein